jgi:hypothetical protein
MNEPRRHKGHNDDTTKKTPSFLVFPLCVLCAFVVNPVLAAPPTLTHLFPAGGQRGTSVEVTAAGSFEHWPVHTWVSGCGVEAKPDNEKGKLTITVGAEAVPGTYWLRLYDEQGASAPQPFLVGTLPEITEREPNDDVAKPQRLDSSSVIVNGRLGKPGDVDCFALHLGKGQTLVAALEAYRTLRSPMDAVLQVVSTGGFVLAQDNDTYGLDPFLAFSVPKDGTYVVRAFAFPAIPDSTIRFAGAETYIYRLTLTTGGYADFAKPLAVNRASPGAVELVGWNIPDDAKKLAVTAVNGEGEATLFHPAVANAVTVRVEPYACIARPAASNADSKPFPIDPPVTVTGHLRRAGAADWYSLSAKKGQKLVIRAESRALGLSVSAVMRVTDEAQKVLAQIEPTGLDSDTELSFTPPQDGRYRLQVRDRYGHGGPRHVYRLRVTEAEPDFALTVAADRFTVIADSALELPVTVSRLNGLAGEIELSAEGLPPGVEAPVVTAGPGAGKVSLKLMAEAIAVGAAGPFRVAGKAKSGLAVSRTATASLPSPFDGAPTVRTEDLWLTVVRPPDAKPKK